MKKILVIQGHPHQESFNTAIASMYVDTLVSSGKYEVKQLILRDLDFSLNLQYGYSKRIDLEPDLLRAQNMIQWADHLVWIHPLWWGGMPALMKGFIDRVFLPGFGFKYRENSVWWDKLLKGKSARIFITMDQPYWYYWLVNGRPSIHQLKKMTLQFCGINPVKVTTFGPIKGASEKQLTNYLNKVKAIASGE